VLHASHDGSGVELGSHPPSGMPQPLDAQPAKHGREPAVQRGAVLRRQGGRLLGHLHRVALTDDTRGQRSHGLGQLGHERTSQPDEPVTQRRRLPSCECHLRPDGADGILRRRALARLSQRVRGARLGRAGRSLDPLELRDEIHSLALAQPVDVQCSDRSPHGGHALGRRPPGIRSPSCRSTRRGLWRKPFRPTHLTCDALHLPHAAIVQVSTDMPARPAPPCGPPGSRARLWTTVSREMRRGTPLPPR
jgi:hypothetical protein